MPPRVPPSSASPDPMSPTPSTSSDMKTPGKTEKDPDDPEPAYEGDIQMDYSSDSCTVQPKYRNTNKKITCKNLGQYRYHLIIWDIH
jgi:hypothetical protein